MLNTISFKAHTDGAAANRRGRAGLTARIRQYLRVRRDTRKLEELPDYLLEDIGLTRGDISSARQYRLF